MSARPWIKQMLERHGVPYEERYHADAFTSQQVAEHERFGGRHVAKVVVVLADGRFIELVLPATRQVSLERVREVLNARAVRLATEEEMQQHLSEAEVGAAPPLRHWPAVPILMDVSMMVKGDILMQAGTHTDAVRVRFDDWFNLVHPRVESFSAPVDNAAREHGTAKHVLFVASRISYTYFWKSYSTCFTNRRRKSNG